MILDLLVRTALLLCLMGVVLLGAGGDWRWPQGWLFLGEFGIASLALGLWLAQRDPALLKERLSLPVQRNQQAWDRIFMSSVIIVFFLWLAMIGLDARRFHWSHMPIAGHVLGALFIALCMLVNWQIFRVNSFAVPQARVQAERAQRVVSEGPYRFVRHPMYFGAIFFFFGVPLMLGSWLGVALAPFLVIGLALRAVGEEHMLLRALPGYADYAQRVKFRLIPGIW